MDLRVICPEQEQYNELMKAYMRASVPSLAVPQDNVLFASIYKFLKENKLRTFSQEVIFHWSALFNKVIPMRFSIQEV